MGQLGFTEMIVIFIIALLVFGPKKLPELGKSLGKGIREFRRATDDLKSSWDDHMREVETPLKEVKRDIQETTQDMKNDFYQSGESKPPETVEASPATEASKEASHPTEPAVPKEHV